MFPVRDDDGQDEAPACVHRTDLRVDHARDYRHRVTIANRFNREQFAAPGKEGHVVQQIPPSQGSTLERPRPSENRARDGAGASKQSMIPLS